MDEEKSVLSGLATIASTDAPGLVRNKAETHRKQMRNATDQFLKDPNNDKKRRKMNRCLSRTMRNRAKLQSILVTMAMEGMKIDNTPRNSIDMIHAGNQITEFEVQNENRLRVPLLKKKPDGCMVHAWNCKQTMVGDDERRLALYSVADSKTVCIFGSKSQAQEALCMYYYEALDSMETIPCQAEDGQHYLLREAAEEDQLDPEDTYIPKFPSTRKDIHSHCFSVVLRIISSSAGSIVPSSDSSMKDVVGVFSSSVVAADFFGLTKRQIERWVNQNRILDGSDGEQYRLDYSTDEHCFEPSKRVLLELSKRIIDKPKTHVAFQTIPKDIGETPKFVAVYRNEEDARIATGFAKIRTFHSWIKSGRDFIHKSTQQRYKGVFTDQTPFEPEGLLSKDFIMECSLTGGTLSVGFRTIPEDGTEPEIVALYNSRGAARKAIGFTNHNFERFLADGIHFIHKGTNQRHEAVETTDKRLFEPAEPLVFYTKPESGWVAFRTIPPKDSTEEPKIVAVYETRFDAYSSIGFTPKEWEKQLRRGPFIHARTKQPYEAVTNPSNAYPFLPEERLIFPKPV